MNCLTCERQISAYIDDELEIDVRRQIENHLDVCETCRREVENHQACWETAHLIPTASPSEGLWEAIASHLQTEASGNSLEDLALMLRGLSGQVQGLQRSVDALRQRDDEGEWVEERQTTAAWGRGQEEIRVRSKPRDPGTPRQGSMDRLNAEHPHLRTLRIGPE